MTKINYRILSRNKKGMGDLVSDQPVTSDYTVMPVSSPVVTAPNDNELVPVSTAVTSVPAQSSTTDVIPLPSSDTPSAVITQMNNSQETLTPVVAVDPTTTKSKTPYIVGGVGVLAYLLLKK